MRIKIYGSSDDLIEVDGDISGEGEAGKGHGFVELSTGDVFRLAFDGCWNVAHHVDSAKCTIVESVVKTEEDAGGYTGHMVVDGPIEWVDFWEDWPPTRESIISRLEMCLDALSEETLRLAYADVRAYKARRR